MIELSFYGDQLTASMDTREAVDTGSALYESLIAEAAQRAGMPSADELPADPEARELFGGIGSVILDRLHDQLGWIAARSGLDSVYRKLLSGGPTGPSASANGSIPGTRATPSPSAARCARHGGTG